METCGGFCAHVSLCRYVFIREINVSKKVVGGKETCAHFIPNTLFYYILMLFGITYKFNY
jgi:hypothetical protein